MRICRQLLVLLACGLLAAGCASAPRNSLAHHDSSKWSNAIAAFESADAIHPPPPGCIVFTGSSYIKRWTNLVSDFPDLPVVNRGFGGCQLADVWCYADKIVIAYQPRTVVIYAGGNDLNAGKSPDMVYGDFVALMTKLRQCLPQAKLVFISCPPSPKRWSQTTQIRRTNSLIADFCQRRGIIFINTFDLMLGADGLPRPDIYVDDRLHMNETGYAIWRKALAPHLN